MTQYSKYPITGVPTYASVTNFPATGNVNGSLAVARDTSTLYEWNGTAWIAIGTPGAAIALDGLISDVTATGPGVATATIQAGVVSNLKLATMVNNTVKGNKSGITASPTDLALNSVTEATSNILTITNGSRTIVGTSNLTIQVKQSSGSQSGYLSASDWNTFNNSATATVPIDRGGTGLTDGSNLTSSTEWASYEPNFSAGFGTVSGSSFLWRRTGDSMEVKGKFTLGTVAAGVGTIDLPNALNIDFNKLTTTSGQYCGQAFDNALAGGVYAVIAPAFTNYVEMGGLLSVINFLGPANMTLYQSNDPIQIYFSVPIDGWTNNN